MSKSIILECRQKDSSIINKNGDYETMFNSGSIEINEGDIITLKSAYIDTTLQNQYNFENDIMLYIEFGYYITDWSTGQGKTNYINSDLSGQDFCTGAIYSPYKLISGASFAPNAVEFVTGIIYYVGPTYSESVQFVFTYNDINGRPRTLIKNYPDGYFENEKKSGTITKIDSTTPFYCQKGTFLATEGTIERMTTQGIVPPYFNLQTSEPTEDVLTPYVLTANILIPAGNYTAENLAQLLTEKMATNKMTNNPGVFNNSFIAPVNIFDVGKPDPEDPTTNIEQTVFWYNQTGYDLEDPILDGEPTGTPLKNGFSFEANSNTLVGASQLTWQYDPVSEKLQLLYSYTPMYDATNGANISVYYLRQGSDFDSQQRRGNIFTCARHSGIYFTGLSATDTITKKQIPFWENLGFDLTKICAQPLQYRDNELVTTIFNIPGVWSYYNLINGINVTDGYVGVDSIIKKAVNEWYEVTEVPQDSNSGFVSTIQASTLINSNLSIPQIFTPYSHFLISCDLNYTTSYHGGDSMYNKISAIVSRYYAYGSYTSGDGAQSIQYEHMGAPIYLKNARIRILTPDKIVDPNLGDDNTVMMEIIKPLAPPAISATTPNKKVTK